MLHWPINEYGLRHFSSDPELLRNPPTIENAYSTLAELKKEGLIRCIGVSNFGTTQMQEVLRTGVALDVNEMPYNIVSRAIEVDIAPFCEENNISLLGSMALQQGLLAGKYHCAQEVPAFQAHSRHFSSIRGGEASRHTEEGAENEIFAVVRRITELAEELRITPAELSIAWILSKPFMSSILVGCRTRQQLETNIKACETVLPPHVIAEIDRISLPVLEKLGPSPDYYEDRENSRIY